ncbi:four helix bundle protein [Dyadobacter sp. LHD-138]|uniref:four helix bundle protein n=1 Tax=Dyadobacter sp. LHD-138 TaxID=3071413 RepID=UPI0027E19D9D|nr:four helix bundle protein [Dyadobacter sp. LHD-138]MDQ6478307.1 four helix bundle protein [Dyadobacter sp. LHD-138]
MKDYKDLLVWQKSHFFALAIYQITRTFPREEIYGLTSQMRRCSISVPSNISEGCGRLSDKELAHFLVIASGSASELDYQLMLSKDLLYIDSQVYEQLNQNLTEIRKMLNAFIKKLNSK